MSRLFPGTKSVVTLCFELNSYIFRLHGDSAGVAHNLLLGYKHGLSECELVTILLFIMIILKSNSFKEQQSTCTKLRKWSLVT